MAPPGDDPEQIPAPPPSEAPSPGRPPWLLPLLFFCALHLPFLGQAVHMDDTNFLRLAEGLLQDPSRPQDIAINWLGTQERAFDVLSNPPGIAFLLALAGDISRGTVLHHALLLPFTALAAWGGILISTQLLRGDPFPGLLLMASPALVVSAHTLMPDLPLMGCLLAGLGLFIRGVEANLPRDMLLGALLGGLASLFRYSGLLFFPIALLYALVGAKAKVRLPLLILSLTLGLLPSALWALHGALFYGIPHVLHMVVFQGGERGENKGLMQLAAQVSFLGGAALLPLVGALRGRGPALAFALGAGVGAALSQGLWESIQGALFMGSGWALLASALTQGIRGGRTRIFLLSWLLLALVFNQALRFASVRYLLPALPALILLWAMDLRGRRLGQITLYGGIILSLAISLGDTLQAQAYADAARDALKSPRENDLYVAGHWGLQYYLEQGGAQALDDPGPPLAQGALVVSAQLPWPQELPQEQGPMVIVKEQSLNIPWPIRTLSVTPAACWYSNSVATASLMGKSSPRGSRKTLLPYAISWDPFDIVTSARVPPSSKDRPLPPQRSP